MELEGMYVGDDEGNWIQSDTTCADLGVENDAQEWTETEEENINPADEV